MPYHFVTKYKNYSELLAISHEVIQTILKGGNEVQMVKNSIIQTQATIWSKVNPTLVKKVSY